MLGHRQLKDKFKENSVEMSYMSPEPSAVPVMLTADDRHCCQV